MLQSLNFFAAKPVDPREIADSNLQRVNKYGKRFGLVPIVAIAILAATAKLDQSAQIVAFCLAITAAAFATGGVLGFIFGIPRSLSDAAEAPPAPATGASSSQAAAAASAKRGTNGSTVNSNLVQVSDWLTKVLLGAALTQIAGIYEGFTNLVGQLAPFLGATGTCVAEKCQATAFGHGVIGGLLIYGLIFGFMWGHLWTTLFLNVAYRDLENTLNSILNPSSVDLLRSTVKPQLTLTTPGSSPSAPTRTDLKVSDETRKAAENIAKVPLQQLATAVDLVAWARAKLVLGDVDNAVVAYRQALALQPNNPDLMIELAEALGSNDRHKDAGEQYRLVGALPSGAIDDTRRNEARFNAALSFLYVPAPEGFTAALEQLALLQAAGSFERNPHFWVLVASAHGQAYRHKSTATGAVQAQLDDHRRQALEAVRKVKALSMSWTEYLRTLWRPADYHNNGVDNDLEAFKDDAEFATELAAGPEPDDGINIGGLDDQNRIVPAADPETSADGTTIG